MFRKGQNYRFYIAGTIVAEETSLTRTRGVDTEDASNKDLAPDSSAGELGGAQPIATYKTQTFQVEAQGAGAKTLFAAALALMNSEGGAVGWAETSGTANRTGSPTYVKAICNDLTINAPNRQPCTCTAQFTVIPGTPSTPSPGTPAAVTTNILRGEFLRLFIGTSSATSPIALATNVSLHVSLSLEDATTKDVTSTSGLSYKSQEATQITFDITSDCLYGGNSGATNIDTLTEGNIYECALCDASGNNQWTQGTTLVSGKAMLTSLGTNAPTGQNITHNGSFTGVGTLHELEPEQGEE